MVHLIPAVNPGVVFCYIYNSSRVSWKVNCIHQQFTKTMSDSDGCINGLCVIHFTYWLSPIVSKWHSYVVCLCYICNNYRSNSVTYITNIIRKQKEVANNNVSQSRCDKVLSNNIIITNLSGTIVSGRQSFICLPFHIEQ